MDLTREQVLELQACRHTNWLIHMEVFGNKAWKYRMLTGGRYHTRVVFSPDKPTYPSDVEYTEIMLEDIVEGKMNVYHVPDYTRDLNYAYRVVDKFPQEVLVRKRSFKSYRCWIARSTSDVESGWCASDPSAPLAICKAALLAVKYEV